MSVRIAPFLFLCCALSLTGCGASVSRVTSFVDSAYAHTTFRRIAIAADVGNLATMRELESKMVAALGEQGTGGIARYGLLSPTREWTREQMLAAFAHAGADGYMLITVDTSQVVEHHEPAKSTTTIQRVTPKKGEDDDATETTVTEHTDGYSYKSITTRFRMTLREMKSAETAWLAVSELESYGPSQVMSYCEEIVEKLQSDRLIVAPAAR